MSRVASRMLACCMCTTGACGTAHSAPTECALRSDGFWQSRTRAAQRRVRHTPAPAYGPATGRPHSSVGRCRWARAPAPPSGDCLVVVSATASVGLQDRLLARHVNVSTEANLRKVLEGLVDRGTRTCSSFETNRVNWSDVPVLEPSGTSFKCPLSQMRGNFSCAAVPVATNAHRLCVCSPPAALSCAPPRRGPQWL